MRSYIIKIWENEDLREQGISDIIRTDIKDIRTAVQIAQEIQNNNRYACIEVQDNQQKTSYYMQDMIEEKIFEKKYLEAIKQEKINYLYKLMYGDKNIVFINEDMIGKANVILKELDTIKQNLIEEYQEDSKDIIKEVNELKDEILDEYDEEDIIKLYEHPMAIVPMLNSNKGTLKDMRETLLSMVEVKEIPEVALDDVIDAYMGYNDIGNFMEYSSDSNIYTNPSFSSLYKDLMDLLNIKYINVYTNDVSDGKYVTTIEFNNEKSITIDINAWSEIEAIKENLKSIVEYEKTIENEKNNISKLRVIYKEVGKEPKVIEIEDTLEAQQKLVEGLIEVVPYKDNLLLICNEEGKINNLAPNLQFDYDYIAGNCFIVGDDFENEGFKSVEDKQIEEIKKDLKDRSIETCKEIEQEDMEF